MMLARICRCLTRVADDDDDDDDDDDGLILV
jgi:hypothetical protein